MPSHLTRNERRADPRKHYEVLPALVPETAIREL
jgi:hypothetical protein